MNISVLEEIQEKYLYNSQNQNGVYDLEIQNDDILLLTGDLNDLSGLEISIMTVYLTLESSTK